MKVDGNFSQKYKLNPYITGGVPFVEASCITYT